MNKQQKEEIVNALSEHLSTSKNFYVADISNLTANQTSALRRLCFERGVSMQVVKNTLIQKALEQANIETGEMQGALKGSSSIMTAESSTAPAKLIKEFRASNDKPVLKAAYIEESFYVGDNMLDTLLTLKSKEQLIGEIIGLLKSPMQNVISGLQGGGHKIAGILKTLSEKPE
jgi:large subunit ribosomal protein L10